MRGVRIVVTTVLILALTAACSKQGKWEQKIKVVDGVTIIQNPGVPFFHEEPARTFELVEKLSIGRDGGDHNYIFYRAWDIDADSHGNIYVMDNGNYRIQKFDSTGNYLLTIGRKGEGPGEFKDLREIAIDSKDNLIVYDSGNQRVSIFNPQGELVKDFKIMKWISWLMVDSKDRILLATDYTNYYKKTRTVTLERFSQDGEFINRIFEETQPVFAVTSKGAAGAVYTEPFYITIDPEDNVYVVKTKKYKIKMYSPDGVLVREFSRQYKSVPLTKEEKKNYKGGSVILDGKTYAPPVPDYKNDITNILGRPNRELWVFTSTREDEKGWVVDVFDSQGKYLRKLYFKSRLKPWRTRLKDNKIYSIESLKDGYLRVKVHILREI